MKETRRKYKEACSVYFDTKFGEYGGKLRFEVRHSAHPPCVVAAPDENSALVAAANYNGLRWTDYSYYAYAQVLRCLSDDAKRKKT